MKVGKIIRRLSIDEMPQFFNVLIGDMSLVGPRPHMSDHTKYYSKEIQNFMQRHKCLPGITGWAQVNGRDELTIQEKTFLDNEYFLKKSFWFCTSAFWRGSSFFLFPAAGNPPHVGASRDFQGNDEERGCKWSCTVGQPPRRQGHATKEST